MWSHDSGLEFCRHEIAEDRTQEVLVKHENARNLTRVQCRPDTTLRDFRVRFQGLRLAQSGQRSVESTIYDPLRTVVLTQLWVPETLNRL